MPTNENRRTTDRFGWKEWVNIVTLIATLSGLGFLVFIGRWVGENDTTLEQFKTELIDNKIDHAQIKSQVRNLELNVATLTGKKPE